MLRDVRRKNREELEERVCFWADNATGAMPSKGLWKAVPEQGHS